MYAIDIKKKGLLGELIAQAYYTSNGWNVFVPLGNTRCDLIVEHPETGQLIKVQVKTVQENHVGGVTYLQCRVCPNMKNYRPHEVDEFIFIYKNKVLEVRTYEEQAGRTSANFGRLDVKK